MHVSILGLGAHELHNRPNNEVERLLHRTLDVGINVIDTAECYGESEERIGRALGSRRNECHLFTKCGHSAGLDLPD